MINGEMLKKSIISGANNLKNNRDLVDKMNVFPVPDGDTGTNMTLTITSNFKGFEELAEDCTVCQVASTAATYMLKGSRGNSGVILSLLFKGFAEGLKDQEMADGKDLVRALSLGVDRAYGAVSKPAEGTILTVARVAYETGKDALMYNDELVYVWQQVCSGAQTALESTPDLLPILKKAGVLDAGGKGLCYIFEGMLSVFKENKVIELLCSGSEGEGADSSEDFENTIKQFDGDIEHTYCTEFIVGRKKAISIDPGKLSPVLEKIGDCVVVVFDDEIIKVHVHTELPDKVLNFALKYGDLLDVKITNMREQNRVIKSKKPKKLSKVEPTEEYGFVSVCAGDGIKALFEDLGVDTIISGGQTMNPSTSDIMEAVFATPAKTVFVLPNNKNIILAAEQVIDLVEDRKVVVLPTKTIPQGISSVISFDCCVTDIDEITNTMLEASRAVKTGLITAASKSTEIAGFKIKEGDIIALKEGTIAHKSKDVARAAMWLTNSLADKESSFITIFYGSDVTKAQAEFVQKAAQVRFPAAEITLVDGGQPVYYFIISAE